ncbi:MAG: hypothetical protein U9Q85_04090 [Patescibacteria group bacterium]|nr:hypothetical protein [Patescibacteria group bacterium]
MLKISRTQQDLKNDLDLFIWDFKIGDNILYNLNIIFALVDDYNNEKKLYKKPISIMAVSVVEAIMVDFIYRLYSGTNHFPVILRPKEDEIKSKLKGETIRKKITDPEGKEHEFSVLKNFNFTPMIEVYEELELLGSNEGIYKFLIEMAYFRNRVHINNYFGNFEKDEIVTFSSERVQKTLDVMVWFFDYFKKYYSRPWKKV